MNSLLLDSKEWLPSSILYEFSDYMHTDFD